MEIHLLDMGSEKYGDCILITKGNRKILIDGAHPKDTSSIRFQLSKLLGQQSPFNFDLLIVTHCHSDHIGCLPELIRLGEITADIALLADPAFRWSDGFDNSDSFIEAALAEALNEEDRSDMSNEELEQFLFDAPRLGPGYQAMIDQLRENGKVILYQGVEEDYSDLENKFKDFGLSILGPTKKHLVITQDSLNKKPSRDAVSEFRDSIDAKIVITDAYRSLASSIEADAEEGEADIINKGAINDQSIVIKLKSDGWTALLAGDMQFAKAEVTGLTEEMDKLLVKVFEEGPYDFIKTSHHTSYNGLNEEMLDHWIGENTSFFAHTGGLNDASHPESDVLEFLKARKNKINFARTDRNGIISMGKDNKGILKIGISKGEINDFSKNKTVPNNLDIIEATLPSEPKQVSIPKTVSTAILPVVEEIHKDEVVVVTTKIPHKSTIVKITIDIDPQKKKLSNEPDREQAVTRNLTDPQAGRFDNLVFVTCSSKLRTNIGEAESERIIKWIQDLRKSSFVDLPVIESATDARKLVQQNFTSSTKGVVIIGGYDVVPAMQLDVLDAQLRNILTKSQEIDDDADFFIIWSDDIYGDLNGDTLPELPVSRIPDGKSADLILSALGAEQFKIKSKFGIRNLDRPFAIDIYETIPSNDVSMLEVSETCAPTSIHKEKAQGAVYYMLHGADYDATRYWGERKGGGFYEAIDIDNVPTAANGTVVFSGCCWGALTVQPPAYKKTPTTVLRPRTSEQSIALAYLRAGALAFVGCTGTHYSPKKAPYKFFGGPMHDAFWKALSRGLQPAEALFEAKKEYATDLPHGLEKPISKAIEMKILRQFTCLGLGW